MDKKLSGLFILFFLSFFVFLSLIVFRKPLSQLTRASANTPSPEKTLLLAWPLDVVASRNEDVTISVFVRNGENGPVPRRQVAVQSTLGSVDPVVTETDDNGKATFILKNTTPGTAAISAVVDSSITVTQTVSVVYK